MVPRLHNILIGEALDIPKIQDHTIVRFTGMICNYTSQSDLDRITMTMQMATLFIMIRDAMT